MLQLNEFRAGNRACIGAAHMRRYRKLAVGGLLMASTRCATGPLTRSLVPCFLPREEAKSGAKGSSPYCGNFNFSKTEIHIKLDN